MNPPLRVWMRLRASFWFTPGLILLVSMMAAVGLIELDAYQSTELARWSPRLFGAGADGSRAMLSAIATSMVTVAGVVFSITIVTLSLTATQYSPRVLRNFMRDAPTQAVLGVFVGVFAYCLLVLRTIRGGDEGGFIPSLAVLGGMAYAFAAIAMLIYFIHHVAIGIQASTILGRIASDTAAAIDHLYPQELGEPPQEPDAGQQLPSAWAPLRAERSGYVQSVDAKALLRAAGDLGRVLRLCVSVGEYVVEGAVLAQAAGAEPLLEDQEARVRSCVTLSRQRSVEQDAGFGMQQLVDVALRALSPGVNDPTTACMCVNELAALLARLAGRAMPAPHRFEGGQLRVIAPAPDFDTLLLAALRPLVRHSRGDLQVLAVLAVSLETVFAETRTPERTGAVRELSADLQAEAARIRPRRHARQLRARLQRLRRLVAARGDPAPLA